MNLPTIEVYSSIECPYAYLATYRLRQVWPEFAGRVRVVWRALSLEYINRRIGTPPPMFEAEKALFARIEPNLPWQPWTRPAWEWPATMWPAFEALACAQAQGHEAAWAMSWALRYAFFAEGRRGWHELKLNGSLTFVLPGGRHITNPALGKIDFDEDHYVLRSYTPYLGDPLAAYREMLAGAPIA
jgi:hypothetical protein